MENSMKIIIKDLTLPNMLTYHSKCAQPENIQIILFISSPSNINLLFRSPIFTATFALLMDSLNGHVTRMHAKKAPKVAASPPPPPAPTSPAPAPVKIQDSEADQVTLKM